MKRRILLTSACATLLSGCASAPVHNWKISALPGQVRQGNGSRISVRSIGLPGSLNQSGVPKSGNSYAADTFQNDLWAAPFADLLQTAMVENLTQRLPNDTVLAGGGSIGAAPDQIVEIQILSFSPQSSGDINLLAQLAARPSSSQNWQLKNFSANTPGGQTAEIIVAGMSRLWSEAADSLAAMLS